VISLGGCTASFVSPEGLVITNHHCATNQIQINSTPAKNLLETGFNAATQADELSGGPNARVFVTENIRDVTADVKSRLNEKMDGATRDKAIEAVGKALVGGVRKNTRLPLQHVAFLWRPAVQTFQAKRNQGCTPGLRTATLGRQLRWRNRQLDVAAPYR